MKKALVILFLLIIVSLSGQFQRKNRDEAPIQNVSSQENIEIQATGQQSFISKNTEQQKELRGRISASLRDFKTNKSKKVLFISLLVAFLYGVVHSLGPGHGKVFLVSQVIGSEVKFGAIVGASLLFAFLHSLSGLTLVAVLKLLSMKILQKTQLNSPCWHKKYLLLLSSTLGLYILIKAIRNKPKREHQHEGRNLFITALLIGFVPCPGSIIISVYAMKMGTYALGVFMIIAMALGMASTLIILNGITLLVKSFATKSLANQESIGKISRIMTIVGSSLLIVLGTMFLFYR